MDNSGNNENWFEDFTGSKDYEVKVGLKWYIQLPIIICIFLMTYNVANGDEVSWRGFRVGPDNVWILEIFAVIIFFAFFKSMKCTAEGFYAGYNFYLFSFYSNRLQRWETFPHLREICESNFVGNFGVYNFIERIKLISQNKRIKPYIRKKYLDYVNGRKQRTIKSKILSAIIFIIYMTFAIYAIYAFLVMGNIL